MLNLKIVNLCQEDARPHPCHNLSRAALSGRRANAVEGASCARVATGLLLVSYLRCLVYYNIGANYATFWRYYWRVWLA